LWFRRDGGPKDRHKPLSQCRAFGLGLRVFAASPAFTAGATTGHWPVASKVSLCLNLKKFSSAPFFTRTRGAQLPCLSLRVHLLFIALSLWIFPPRGGRNERKTRLESLPWSDFSPGSGIGASSVDMDARAADAREDFKGPSPLASYSERASYRREATGVASYRTPKVPALECPSLLPRRRNVHTLHIATSRDSGGKTWSNSEFCAQQEFNENRARP
jgi:hypothetical protein